METISIKEVKRSVDQYGTSTITERVTVRDKRMIVHKYDRQRLEPNREHIHTEGFQLLVFFVGLAIMFFLGLLLIS